MSSRGDSTAESLTERVHGFVSENKRAILLGTAAAAAIAIAGVAYLASTSSRGSTNGAGNNDEEKGERRAREKKKSSKKRKSGKDKDGPILRERTPPPAVDEVTEDPKLTAEQIAAMSDVDRKELSSRLKAKGNTAYGLRKFSIAADLYTQAIEASPTPEPVFYSNRAACYINMVPPKDELVVQDCDKALALDKKYVKALNRRATALERLNRFEEALRDFTAATILNHFRDEAAAQAVERVLKRFSMEKAEQILATRERRLPSVTFTSSYFNAFRTRPHPTLPESPSDGDRTLLLAFQALEAGNYIHSLTLVNEALTLGISWDVGEAEALNLRGTFKFLTGDTEGSKTDLLASVKLVPSFTQSLVKVASVYMEQSDQKKTFECFEDAIKQNPKDPDIYYHRGQVLFILNDFAQAAENYKKSTELDDQFVFSHIQLAVAQYKSGEVGSSMATFRRTLKAFPQRSEPQNYYGELLLDQQRFQDAVEKFDRAVELEKQKPPPMNVLPLVNKGLALYQMKQDISAAEECCNEALGIDPECDAAVVTLAQLSLQLGKVEQAVGLFARQAELARNQLELVNALTYQYASTAQVEFLKNYPDMAAQLSQIARHMM